MYSSMRRRPRSASRATSPSTRPRARRSSTRRVEDRSMREVVAVVAPRVAFVLVGEAVRLPRDREPQVVPVVARDARRRRRRARPTCVAVVVERHARAQTRGSRRRRRRRCGRRRGRRVSVSSTIAVLYRTACVRRGPSAPSGQYASAPPSQSWNHAMPVAIGMRHSSNRPGVVHDDEQPLRHELAVGAAELGHVGVHGELLARHHEVRVHDRGLDHRPAVDRAAPRRRTPRGGGTVRCRRCARRVPYAYSSRK